MAIREEACFLIVDFLCLVREALQKMNVFSDLPRSVKLQYKKQMT